METDNQELEQHELEELQRKIELLELSRINLRVHPSVFDRLLKLAEFKGQTVEEYCTDVLTASLDVAVGAPVISAPSFGQAVGKKVTAPMGLVQRA
jgi:hypothetical protein